MKRFKFRLERVLQYRKVVKDEKLRDLLLKNAELDRQHARLKELQAAYLLNSIEDTALLAAEEVQLMGNYSARLKHEIEQQEEKVEETEKDVAQAQEIYVEAAQEEEMLVKLRERRQDEHREQEALEEGKFLDELTVQRNKNNFNSER